MPYPGVPKVIRRGTIAPGEAIPLPATSFSDLLVYFVLWENTSNHPGWNSTTFQIPTWTLVQDDYTRHVSALMYYRSGGSTLTEIAPPPNHNHANTVTGRYTVLLVPNAEILYMTDLYGLWRKHSTEVGEPDPYAGATASDAELAEEYDTLGVFLTGDITPSHPDAEIIDQFATSFSGGVAGRTPTFTIMRWREPQAIEVTFNGPMVGDAAGTGYVPWAAWPYSVWANGYRIRYKEIFQPPVEDVFEPTFNVNFPFRGRTALELVDNYGFASHDRQHFLTGPGTILSSTSKFMARYTALDLPSYPPSGTEEPGRLAVDDPEYMRLIPEGWTQANIVALAPISAFIGEGTAEDEEGTSEVDAAFVMAREGSIAKYYIFLCVAGLPPQEVWVGALGDVPYGIPHTSNHYATVSINSGEFSIYVVQTYRNNEESGYNGLWKWTGSGSTLVPTQVTSIPSENLAPGRGCVTASDGSIWFLTYDFGNGERLLHRYDPATNKHASRAIGGSRRLNPLVVTTPQMDDGTPVLVSEPGVFLEGEDPADTRGPKVWDFRHYDFVDGQIAHVGYAANFGFNHGNPGYGPVNEVSPYADEADFPPEANYEFRGPGFDGISGYNMYMGESNYEITSVYGHEYGFWDVQLGEYSIQVGGWMLGSVGFN